MCRKIRREERSKKEKGWASGGGERVEYGAVLFSSTWG